MLGQAQGTAPTVTPPDEVLSRDPGVDPDPAQSLTTLHLHVSDALTETALNAIASASGFATTTTTSPCDYVVTDRIGAANGPQTILLIDPIPCQARAAVEAVADGRICSVLSTQFAEHLAEVIWAARNGLALIPNDVLRMARKAPPVTDRQGRILRDLAAGLSNRQVATRECVSVATVKRDILTLFKSFDCSNRFELVSRSTAFGYIT